jgi:Mn2+/Fe2+ NRAMP family transporter
MGKSLKQARLSAMGPGLIMASAAVGASHLVASTQAGALFGWQLLWLIVLVNVLKYPFFRFGVQYTLNNNESLIEGYQRKSRSYLIAFTALNLVAAAVNTAGVLLLTASLLQYFIPWNLSLTILCLLLLSISLLILLAGHYRLLDNNNAGVNDHYSRRIFDGLAEWRGGSAGLCQPFALAAVDAGVSGSDDRMDAGTH